MLTSTLREVPSRHQVVSVIGFLPFIFSDEKGAGGARNKEKNILLEIKVEIMYVIFDSQGQSSSWLKILQRPGELAWELREAWEVVGSLVELAARD